MACRILIIDDDYEILDMLKILLEVEEYSVDTASNGFTGLEKLKKSSYDIIILDLNLPDITGEQLCKAIRKNINTPILILSAKESVTDKVLCLEYGADDYITKPFQNMELIARVKAILRRCSCSGVSLSQNEPVIMYKSFIIDTENMVIKRDDEAINLTPKEFEILLYLVKNKGKVVSREKLINDLWGKDSLYRWSRSVDVHIQHIRQKLDPNKGHLYLKTISGVGYKLEE